VRTETDADEKPRASDRSFVRVGFSPRPRPAAQAARVEHVASVCFVRFVVALFVSVQRNVSAVSSASMSAIRAHHVNLDRLFAHLEDSARV
jgi:hypothetical protein